MPNLLQFKAPDTAVIDVHQVLVYELDGTLINNGTPDFGLQFGSVKGVFQVTIAEATADGWKLVRITNVTNNTVVHYDVKIQNAVAQAANCHDRDYDNVDSNAGSGMFKIELRIKLDNLTEVPECDCTLTTSNTDPNTDVYASGISNANAIATFYVDEGVYYLWKQKAGLNFDNPDTVTVDAGGTPT